MPSSYNSLENLRGKIFAFSDPDSNTGSLVPRFWLAQKHEMPESFFKRITYTYSHDNSILAVAKGLVDGAAVDGHKWEFYNAKNPYFTSKTRVIKKSDYFGSPPKSLRLALFPFQHHKLLLGAILISFPDDCVCVKTEMDVINLILEQASGSVHRALEHDKEIKGLKRKIDKVSGYKGMVGKDPKIQLIYKLIEDVAPTDATVLIQGESGTGKEMVAKAVHDVSGRSGKPFIVINCSAYPATLLESELFGHEKGAFTGAVQRKTGRFEQASGGTVFLDEIGEISLSAQTMLLRVLQSQKIERIGGDKPIKVNTRVLAATNRNLLEEVKNGNFREDLYYRLNVIPINLPPLRERKNQKSHCQ